MNNQPLVNFSKRLHDIADGCLDFFGPELDIFKRAEGIDEPGRLQRAFEELNDKNRLLNIGIVGRVKAGKSSLLNALVFNGDPILPKAATPMTAALTTLTWGDQFAVNVEFYTEADLAAIKSKSQQFEQKLAALKIKLLEELTALQNAKAPSHQLVDISALPAMADRSALTKMQCEEGLYAAHDQYRRMQESGIDQGELHLHERLEATSPQDLAKRLHEYVGATGRFMPYTKTVHVHMPLEYLRDICIIDTPGMNDPVQSREERTVELLKTCDVVFIVSPAGQFLNEQDLEVMGRITRKEGIQELVLVASQVDTQLYGSEKRTRLNDSVEVIRSHLATRAQSILRDLKKNSPEVGQVFDGLIASVQTNLLHSSGLCHSLHARFNDQTQWDANEQVTWKNLTENYPDFFTADNEELSLNSLAGLANIEAIRQVLQQVRSKKKQIAREKMTGLVSSKRKCLEAFKAEVLRLARHQIAEIQRTSVGELNAQQEGLATKCDELSGVLDFNYEACMLAYRKNLRDSMIKEFSVLLKVSTEGISVAEDTYVETSTREKSGVGSWFARKLWGGGNEEVTKTYARIITSQVHTAILNFMTHMADQLSYIVKQSRYTLDLDLSSTLTPQIRSILNKEDVKSSMIVSAVRQTIAAVPMENFDLEIELPNELRSKGTLKGKEAEQFKDAADDFLAVLSTRTRSNISNFIKTVEKNAPKTISGIFVNALQQRINVLKQQVENSTQAIERLNRIISKTEKVSL